MRRYGAVLVRVVAGAVLLGALSGCEDRVAQEEAQKARQQVSDLKAEVDKLRAEAKATGDKVDAIREPLSREISTRMDKIAADLAQVQGTLLGKISESETKTLAEARKQIDAARDDLDGRMKDALNVRVAEQVAALRKDIQTNREELLGFMDRQLKELYPYAYQPKRLESPGPPVAPQP